MGATGTLLVGIACVLAQGTPEAEKIKQSLTSEEAQLIEQLQGSQVCQRLDEYLQKGNSTENGRIILMGCQSCLKTSMFINLKSDEK